MSTKDLLFQESLPPRIPNPIFIVLMMDSKKGLDEYLNIFDESPLNELDFRYFEFLKRIEYPFHHWNVLLFKHEKQQFATCNFFVKLKKQVGTTKRVSVCLLAA